MSNYPSFVPRGDAGPPGPAGKLYTQVRIVTADVTAVIGECLVINQAGGVGKTITLPPANSCPAGTVISFVAFNPGSGSSNVINADGADNIGASGTATTMSFGDAQKDLAVALVTNGTSRWIRKDQNPNEYAADGVSFAGNAYVVAGGTLQMVSFGLGGVSIMAYGESVFIDADVQIQLGGVDAQPLPTLVSVQSAIDSITARLVALGSAGAAPTVSGTSKLTAL